jgi:acyl-CoA synthetase (AMP-forming)/AMP-acid ligase II
MHWHSHALFLERFTPYGLRPWALATCYAMAENVFAVTQGGIDSPVAVDRVSQSGLLERQAAEPANAEEEGIRMLSAGRPIINTQVKVVDERGRALPERRLGEIALKSNCMLAGYYRRPDLTEKAFLDGWYLTGDLGYLADGEVYITGRKKDLIIVGGKNIYPQDLEALRQHRRASRRAAFLAHNNRPAPKTSSPSPRPTQEEITQNADDPACSRSLMKSANGSRGPISPYAM